MYIPLSRGMMVPTTKPNTWNMGMAFSTTSLGRKSTEDMSWSRLATMFRWLRATPLGVPSDPEVKSTTASSSGLPAVSGVVKRAWNQAVSFALNPRARASSSSHRNLSPADSMASTRAPSFPASTKRRELITVRISAARQQARAFCAPTVQFSMAGVCPSRDSPRARAAVGTLLGIKSPARSPGLKRPPNRSPRARAALTIPS